MVRQIRLKQLDGLRGLAIILVFLAHIRVNLFLIAAPSWVRLISLPFTGNGEIGVAILFLISGYLIKTRYPLVSNFYNFWQKRYTRIFPAFLAVSLAMTVFKFYKNFNIWLILIVFSLVIWLISFIWRSIRESESRVKLGKIIFRSFWYFQILGLLSYLIFQFFIKNEFILQSKSNELQALITWLINVTMILPFGTHVMQLDSIYWSLFTEIIFYLAYPGIFLPIFKLILSKHSQLLNWLSTISCAGFFYGSSIIFQHLLGLQMLKIHLGFYFILGMIISHFSTSQHKLTKTTKFNLIENFWSEILMIILVFSSPLIFKLSPFPIQANQLIWSIQIGWIFLVSISTKAYYLTNWLKTNWLMKIGIYSYAIYLTHNLALSLLTYKVEPETISQTITAIIAGMFLTLIFSAVVYYLLEAPYFNSKISNQPSEKFKSKVPSLNKPLLLKNTCLSISISYLFLIWLAFKLPAPLKDQSFIFSLATVKLPVHKLINYESYLHNYYFSQANDYLNELNQIKQLMAQKIVQPYQNSDAQLAVLLGLPFILILAKINYFV